MGVTDCTCEQRRDQGRARRKQIGRQRLGVWRPKLRRNDPLAALEASMRGRVPALVSLKYERMLASPFGFFRGAVPVMAADLTVLPNTGIINQICGDAHVRNLGAYAAPDGRLVFDINDFDETTRAPFEWDLKRLVASFVIAGREAGEKDVRSREAVLTCIGRYQQYVCKFAAMPVLDVARYQVHGIRNAALLNDVLRKAERAIPLHTMQSLTEPNAHGGERVFRDRMQDHNGSHHTVLWRASRAEKQQVVAALREYRQSLLPERQHILAQYRPVDVCFKVVGTGSVGTRDYCVYLEGNGEADPLFLQMKEEVGSAYLPYLNGMDNAGALGHKGRLVAEGQRAMQMQSDPLLGWTTMAKREYLVRQLNDHKASIEVDELKGEALIAYAEVCGELLARGHARSGDVQLIMGYVGRSPQVGEAMANFALAYADQTEADWQRLRNSRRARNAASAAKVRDGRSRSSRPSPGNSGSAR
jgi:uncharacterized protein (DUF2252 family)